MQNEVVPPTDHHSKNVKIGDASFRPSPSKIHPISKCIHHETADETTRCLGHVFPSNCTKIPHLQHTTVDETHRSNCCFWL